MKVKALTSKQLDLLKGALFVKTMQYELKLANTYKDSLEERVARLITNDLGETLRTEVSYTLIQEFKKFMFLVAWDILEMKHKNQLDSHSYYEDKKSHKKYYSSAFHPPYVLDLVWRFIIQEGKIYSDFWEDIWGGYIDRLNPRIDLKATLSRYEAARMLLEKNERLLRPYLGLWPKLKSKEQLEIDYDFDMLFHTKEKEEELAEFMNKIDVNEIDEFQLVTIKEIIEKWREDHLNDLDDLDELEIDEDVDISKFSNRKKIDHLAIYDKLMEYQFHEKFVQSICYMFMLTDSAGNQLIKEYKNFLFMYYLTNCQVAPSFEIDSFWDLHYASTKDYREFWDEIFGEFLPSKNYDYNEKGIRQRTKQYKKSLEIYEVLFGDEPNEIFWESPVDLTINSKNGFQHMNLFKFICFLVYSNNNDGIEYKNTFRRDKKKFYNDIPDDTIIEINKRNELKLTAAKGFAEFERLAQHPIVEVDDDIDESEEREEAERLVEDSDQSQGTSIGDIEEHEDGAAYKHQRLQANVVDYAGRGEESEESQSEEASNEEEESEEESSEDEKLKGKRDAPNATPRVIYDPVLSKGGFKFIPNYHDTKIFEEDDLIDRIENGLYKDYIHKGSNKFKEIFDIPILSRADVDIIFFPGLNESKKLELGIDERIIELEKEDINFIFDPKESFEHAEDDSEESDDNHYVAEKHSENYGTPDSLSL